MNMHNIVHWSRTHLQLIKSSEPLIFPLKFESLLIEMAKFGLLKLGGPNPFLLVTIIIIHENRLFRYTQYSYTADKFDFIKRNMQILFVPWYSFQYEKFLLQLSLWFCLDSINANYLHQQISYRHKDNYSKLFYWLFSCYYQLRLTQGQKFGAPNEDCTH